MGWAQGPWRFTGLLGGNFLQGWEAEGMSGQQFPSSGTAWHVHMCRVLLESPSGAREHQEMTPEAGRGQLKRQCGYCLEEVGCQPAHEGMKA